MLTDSVLTDRATPTVAQCLWVKPNINDYDPYVADQICHLDRYDSIILTHGERQHHGYPGLPIYAPYRSDGPRLIKVSRRIVGRVLGSSWLFRRPLRKHNVRLLHAHKGPYGILFLPLKVRYGLPLLTSFHGYDASSFAAVPENQAPLRWLFEEGDMFTTVSENMKSDLISLGCPANKIVVHHVGVELDNFKPRLTGHSSDEITILTVGNFQEKKGFSYLIKSMELVRQRFPKIRLRIVGEPLASTADAHEVETLIDELALSENIDLVGFVAHNELVREYENADLFVLPSVTAGNGDKEGVPTVLMEAQASGLPVVSTFHSGIPEVVLDGKSGYLVPEKDVAQLAEKICLLLENPQTWDEMGRLGREHIQQEFNVATQIIKLQKIYDRLTL